MSPEQGKSQTESCSPILFTQPVLCCPPTAHLSYALSPPQPTPAASPSSFSRCAEAPRLMCTYIYVGQNPPFPYSLINGTPPLDGPGSAKSKNPFFSAGVSFSSGILLSPLPPPPSPPCGETTNRAALFAPFPLLLPDAVIYIPRVPLFSALRMRRAIPFFCFHSYSFFIVIFFYISEGSCG